MTFLISLEPKNKTVHFNAFSFCENYDIENWTEHITRFNLLLTHNALLHYTVQHPGKLYYFNTILHFTITSCYIAVHSIVLNYILLHYIKSNYINWSRDLFFHLNP